MNILTELIAKIFREVLNWGQKQAEKPKTTTDAKTPETVRRRWSTYLADKLRDKKRGSD